MAEEKKIFGKELAEKILGEFARISEETGAEMSYTVSLQTEETDPGLKNVPGVKIHVEWDDPVFVPDFEGLTEEEAKNLVEDLAEDFVGPRHKEVRYYVVVEGEEDEEFEDFSSAERYAESLFREKIMDSIKNEVGTHEFKKDESGNWKYKVYFDGDESVFEQGPIIEEREKIWWGLAEK